MRKFRNICIEWIGTCIVVQIALTFGLIWFFNNMVTITTTSIPRNVNNCITHINGKDDTNGGAHQIPEDYTAYRYWFGAFIHHENNNAQIYFIQLIKCKNFYQQF